MRVDLVATVGVIGRERNEAGVTKAGGPLRPGGEAVGEVYGSDGLPRRA